MNNNNLLKRLKSHIKEVNDDLVEIAERGFSGDSAYDEGFADGKRETHLELINLIKEYEG